MGTRATFLFTDGENDLISLYTQFDGYPEGVPLGFVKFLKNISVENGIPPGAELFSIANGYGCLVLQLIAKFKNRPGTLYLANKDWMFGVQYQWNIDLKNQTITDTELDVTMTYDMFISQWDS